MNAYSHYLKIATEAAETGGEILKKYWGKLANVQHKKYSWDLVTEADKESEESILNILKQNFPTYRILSEEAGLHEAGEEESIWVVDPLDGTTNYTHQYPLVSISIALVKRDKPVVGVVFNPIMNELFQATAASGTTLNGKPVSVSAIDTLDYSLLSTGFAYDRHQTEDNNYTEFCHITQISQGVRRGGSAALDLAYVAAGRLDGYWERGLNAWDIAAGALLVQQAGGKATSYEGDPLILESGRILATNGAIHQTLIYELKKVREKRVPKYY